MTLLPTPELGRPAAESFVADHLGHLICDEPLSRSPFEGGQTAADAALASFDVTGYAADRNQVSPNSARGASRLSPYIRHGLLTLPAVWAHVEGPQKDVTKFRDELMWQEYARHLYARLGSRTASALRAQPAQHSVSQPSDVAADQWHSALPCVSLNVEELTETGWLVNQARMWLASHWTVRHQRSWADGEEFFFQHLLDGSRAANRLGWQWTTGAGSHKSYGFSRWQVEKRAPGLCDSCSWEQRCPIASKPREQPVVAVPKPALLASDRTVDQTSGPSSVAAVTYGKAADGHDRGADVVWLTAESLGSRDPALVANPDLPVLFVFDEPLLRRLRLSAKRLVFLVETLAELAADRELQLYRGSPVEILADTKPAVTFAPVPGFRSRLAKLPEAEVHPWPWLTEPHSGAIQSFSAWRRGVDR